MDEADILRRKTPVTEIVIDHHGIDHTDCLCAFDPALHRVISFSYNPLVAIMPVEHINGIYKGRRPCHVVLIERIIPRCNGGHIPFRIHRFLHISRPFLIKSLIIKDICLSITTGGTVTQPRHTLIALRTVRRHTPVIAPDTPERVAMQCVEYGVRAFETAGGLHQVIDDLATERFRSGKIIQT